MRYFYYTVEYGGHYVSNIVKSPIKESGCIPLSDIITDAQIKGSLAYARNIHIILVKEISEVEYNFCKKTYGF